MFGHQQHDRLSLLPLFEISETSTESLSTLAILNKLQGRFSSTTSPSPFFFFTVYPECTLFIPSLATRLNTCCTFSPDLAEVSLYITRYFLAKASASCRTKKEARWRDKYSGRPPYIRRYCPYLNRNHACFSAIGFVPRHKNNHVFGRIFLQFAHPVIQRTERILQERHRGRGHGALSTAKEGGRMPSSSGTHSIGNVKYHNGSRCIAVIL